MAYRFPSHEGTTVIAILQFDSVSMPLLNELLTAGSLPTLGVFVVRELGSAWVLQLDMAATVCALLGADVKGLTGQSLLERG